MKRTELRRTTPMPRPVTPMTRARAPRPRPARDAHRQVAWADLRLALYARCGGRCERCGRDLADCGFDGAHRKGRGQGGPDTPVNVAALCRRCHEGAHANPARACDEGWMVPGWGDPAVTPVTLHNGRRVWLTPGGGYADRAPAGAA